ncbi:MAG: hypothetical protein OHK006_21330 [Thermodesulfovibrionales bacterium]
MDEIAELIRTYRLQEDLEHIIIPVQTEDGKLQRVFLLKRRFFRVVYPDGHFEDYPIAEIVEAIITYPGLALSASIRFVHREPDDGTEEEHAAQSAEEGDSDEEKDSDQRTIP